MKITTLALTALAVTASGAALATPVNLSGANGERTLQQILNDITCTETSGACVTGGTSSIDVANDQYEFDSRWKLGGTGMAASQIVIELAGYANINSFGVYDIHNPNSRVELFAGEAGAGAQALFSLDAEGNAYRNFTNTGVQFTDNLFGFYLTSADNTWYSESSLNSDQEDHMLAFQGTGDRVKLPNSMPGEWLSNEFVLAWEDLAAPGWDWDYNDFVVMVESVNGVPEPGTLALLGLGLAGVGFARRRKLAAAA